jgi:cytochrome c oxidase assembly factor CtaG/cytochrome c2
VRAAALASARCAVLAVALCAVLAITLCAVPAVALAHASDVGKPPEVLLRTFTLDPWVIVPAALLLALYARGFARAPARARSPARALAFVGALALAVASLCTPLDALGAALFSAHMAQHLVLVVLVAPLIALARPGPLLAWAFAARTRRTIARASRPLKPAAAFVAHPASAFVLHTGALLAWHHPALYEAALLDDRVHALEHAALAGTALLFWRALLHAGRPAGMGHGLAVLYAFAATVQGAVLGAVLTSARVPWYRAHTPEGFGLTLLEDQVLAGLLMWVPGGLPYAAAGVLSFLAWLRASEVAARRPRPLVVVRTVGGGLALLALLALAGCRPSRDRPPERQVPGGDPNRGRVALSTHGCGGCHAIPGVQGAVSYVAPPLERYGRRAYVAGVRSNNAETLVQWIKAPESINPGTAMPNLGVDEATARDMAAYLYTLDGE